MPALTPTIPKAGLAGSGAIEDVDRLVGYPFYFAALGELELRLGRGDAAREHYASAGARARNAMERRFFERRALEIRGQD